MPTFGRAGRAGLLAAAAAAPLALVHRFALVYRVRAGYPTRHLPISTPASVGLAFEDTTIPAGGLDLPAWFIPANDDRPGPGVVLVHGWESARDRTIPYAQILHALGYHVLTFDVRGNGANPFERLPVTAGEYGADTRAAFDALMRRPEVTAGAIVGHSMGAIGALIAGAADDRVKAIVSASAPADPTRLTRLTFNLAGLRIPDVIAYPLAWYTTRVYVRPRGHRLQQISATRSAARFRGPLLFIHGELDDVVPVAHVRRLVAAARSTRQPTDAPVETLVLPDGHHSWLYELEPVRRTMAAFLSRALGGPLEPDVAADRAAAVDARRMPEPEPEFGAVETGPQGYRQLLQLVRPIRPPQA